MDVRKRRTERVSEKGTATAMTSWRRRTGLDDERGPGLGLRPRSAARAVVTCLRGGLPRLGKAMERN